MVSYKADQPKVGRGGIGGTGRQREKGSWPASWGCSQPDVEKAEKWDGQNLGEVKELQGSPWINRKEFINAYKVS